VSDVADYCRQVEAHLTRTNGGHMVRVVGAGFALVKQWADDGVPLSVVFRAIEQKAERHKAGTSKRPLRIEFCEADVRELHAAWRRAVGLTGGAELAPSEPVVEASAAAAEPKRRSVSKVIERAIERLGRLAGRLELPGEFRDAVSRAIEQLSVLREELSRTRGAAREPLLERLAPIEHDLLAQARHLRRERSQEEQHPWVPVGRWATDRSLGLAQCQVVALLVLLDDAFERAVRHIGVAGLQEEKRG